MQFSPGETHVFRAQKTASENRAFCGSNAPRFGENVNFQKQRETGCKRLISEPRSVSFGAPQGHPPPWRLDETFGLAALRPRTLEGQGVHPACFLDRLGNENDQLGCHFWITFGSQRESKMIHHTLRDPLVCAAFTHLGTYAAHSRGSGVVVCIMS